MWRPEDEALLGRLEDEVVLSRLFRHHVGSFADHCPSHPRAAGLAAAARHVTHGDVAVQAALQGDVTALARLVEAAPMSERPAPMLHHIAVYFGRVASALAGASPEAAANAWMRALAAWLALGEERTYLAGLEQALASAEPRRTPGSIATVGLVPPERVPLDILADLGKRAKATARDLSSSGRAALLALAWVDDAARIAGAGVDTTSRVRRVAERHRNAALDSALAVVGEALDEATARGELAAVGRAHLQRALEVWAWSGHDAAAEEFVVNRLTPLAWELYRASAWDALRFTFEPFRAVIDNFARRVEQDPSRVAFAAPCAQMFVFLTDIEPSFPRKLELAERAVRLCPAHRNGRLNMASLLCDQAIASMRAMVVFARREDVDRVSAQLARAESLYPQCADLPGARAMLERVRRGRISV